MSDGQLRQTLRALALAVGAEPGDPQPLCGGITNRNFRVRAGGHDLVVRCPGADTDLLGINRDAEHEASLAAAQAQVGPEVVAYLQPGGCLVTRFVTGRTPSEADLRDPAVLARVVTALRAFHASAPLQASFSPFEVGVAYRRIVIARGGSLPASAQFAAQVAEEVRPLLTGAEHDPVPCHNDLLPGNLLLQDDRVTILDWEYAGMGDRFFDLANLSANNGFGEDDDRRLLQAYFGPDGATPRRCARLGLMRLMSDYREGMWGLVQDVVSGLDVDFAAYADEHLERLRITAERPGYRELLQRAAR